MRRLALLSVLVLAAACPEVPVVQPVLDGPAADAVVTADRFAQVNGGLQFSVEVRFVGTVEPATLHPVQSEVLHGRGVVNEWSVEGDMSGPWYFIGDYKVNPKNGMGRSIAAPALFIVEESKWGMTGTWECRNSFKIENWPDPRAFIQYGNLTGCHGTGAFEGMKMKGRMTNEDHPGLGDALTIYDFWGVIW